MWWLVSEGCYGGSRPVEGSARRRRCGGREGAGLEAWVNKASGAAVHVWRAENDGDDDDSGEDDDDEMGVDGEGSNEEAPTLQHLAIARPASQPEVG
ncbi:hypothetical protein FRB95_011530 [Tulasnella sp. JGI-2019a]|nr:hypothetical protein FRB95_011530 [Tulasnella sp. JGI-2019a]